MQWDPGQYARYSDERGRPFVDLVERVRCAAPRRVVDLGCGPGNLTAMLPDRWPDAVIEGVDSSPEMIEKAGSLATDALTFRVGDITTWEAPSDADVVLSNAALQWVPGHLDLVTRWAEQLPRGGWLAFQVPSNFDAPSHTIMRGLAESSRWAPLLDGVLRHADAVATPAVYGTVLMQAGLVIDVWQTTYLHVLQGQDPVLEWVRGTGLRPVLAALDEQQAAEFESDYRAALRSAYPSNRFGTLYPFQRTFVVGSKA